ncbi:hypothetical protein K457DRAFT_25101 [Linnemannia elongata AG-77]|uniref:Uncharacterized protein n=1 Tax=Linnemannia elongata AG-77 TaxID=1314771 RepID=A0A197JE15_9FUNG|nr:hypothetical protein K457DRAFT_25101 [Linnemannia elongata AG-77]
MTSILILVLFVCLLIVFAVTAIRRLLDRQSNFTGHQLASGGGGGGGDRTVRLWDPKTGELVFILKGHTKEITGLAFSPSGHQICFL